MIDYTFDGYRLRLAQDCDLDLARTWTAADPDHAGKVDPGFWIEQTYKAQSWLLTDSAGPIFFFKGVIEQQGDKRVLDVHVQFPPFPSEGSLNDLTKFRRRLTRALIDGTRWLEHAVEGMEEIRFDSKSASLIRFCEKRLGFTQGDQGKLCKRLKSHVRSN